MTGSAKEYAEVKFLYWDAEAKFQWGRYLKTENESHLWQSRQARERATYYQTFIENFKDEQS